MKILFHYILALIDFLNPPTTFFWWEALIGFLEIVSVIAIFVVSVIFLIWYYAILITIGYVAIVCVVSIIIEKLRKRY